LTQAILLGAGQGSRLDAERGRFPKWMLEVHGLSLAQHLVNALHQCDVTEIALARRPLYGSVQTPSITYLEVQGTHNMLETLYSVRGFVRRDVIIVYCDLLVEPRLVRDLLSSKSEASIVVDRRWRNLFELRAEDPLNIAESCVVRNGKIQEIGEPLEFGEVPEAQYIGMMRFSNRMFREMMLLYEELAENFSGRPWRNAASFESAYLTDFLQECVARGLVLDAVEVEGGWLEFDTPRDLKLARNAAQEPMPEVFDFTELWENSSVISSGGAAIRGIGPKQEVLLVGTGAQGEWRIPKGMLAPGETVRKGACREVTEETGIDVEITEFIGTEEWTYEFGGSKWHEKCYFHRMLPLSPIEPKPDGENAVAAWVPVDIAREGMMFQQEKNILHKIIENSP